MQFKEVVCSLFFLKTSNTGLRLDPKHFLFIAIIQLWKLFLRQSNITTTLTEIKMKPLKYYSEQHLLNKDEKQHEHRITTNK